MRYASARTGREFVVRLEHGEIVSDSIESFALAQGIRCARVNVVGGVDTGTKLVVGPRDGRDPPFEPLVHVLSDVHEVTGTGTIFPDESSKPILHLHLACGREGKAVVGCARAGAIVWHILEVTITELLECSASRKLEKESGFVLLSP